VSLKVVSATAAPGTAPVEDDPFAGVEV